MTNAHEIVRNVYAELQHKVAEKDDVSIEDARATVEELLTDIELEHRQGFHGAYHVDDGVYARGDASRSDMLIDLADYIKTREMSVLDSFDLSLSLDDHIDLMLDNMTEELLDKFVSFAESYE